MAATGTLTYWRRLAVPGFAGIALAALTAGAQAQVSPEVQSAMRANCRSDFMSLCSGVSPGGKGALTCLQTNVGKLSAACQTVVQKTLPPPAKPVQAAPATPPPAKPVQAAPVAPPPAPVTAAPPPAAVPPPARPVTSAPPPPARPVTAPRPTAAAPAAVAAPAPAAPPVDAAPGPTPQQIAAIKNTCRGDFRSLCRGVPQGGQEAIACLVNNRARLSPNCKTSVADIADSMPAGPPPAIPAAAPASAPPKPNVVDAAVMLRACKLDLVRHCRGVEPGGGRALACLNQHASNLSVRCRTAMKVTAPLR